MPEQLPKWISGVKSEARRKRWAEWYRRPWTCPPEKRKAPLFKWRLWRHGLVSPNFTRAEAASNDGQKVPLRFRLGCQKHAFKLERVRHRRGYYAPQG